MSNVLTSPALESSAPPLLDDAHVSRYSQRPGPPFRRLWTVPHILAPLCIPGGALLAFVVSFAINTPGGPTMVADQYYSAIKNQDYARAYSYLGSLLKKAFSSGGFALEAQENEAAFGKVSHFTYAATASGEPETAIMTVTRTIGWIHTGFAFEIS